MSNNGRKPISKSESDEHPWWHSGTHCLAALLWCFTLAVLWRGTFSESGMTWPTIGTFALGLTLAVAQSSMASVRGKNR